MHFDTAIFFMHSVDNLIECESAGAVHSGLMQELYKKAFSKAIVCFNIGLCRSGN